MYREQYGEYGNSIENMETVLMWRCEGLILLVIFPISDKLANRQHRELI